MLDAKDLEAIAQMLAEQKSEMLSVMAQQRKEIVEETMHNMQVLLEAEVTPKFNLLVDGQQTLLDTLASKSRVEALEDEVSFLKQMLKTLASEVDNLKKAN